MKPLLLFQGPVATRSGYGSHARDLVMSLIKMDKFDIMIWGTRWGDTPYIDLNTAEYGEIYKRMLKEPVVPKQPEIYVQVSVPNEFQPIGKFNIGITAGIETTACSMKWIEGLNRMNLIIVPSKHAKAVFDNTVYTQQDEQKKPIGEVKVTVPVEVLFEGADTTIYKYTENICASVRNELNAIPEDFCFLYVGHWLNGEMFQDRKDTSGLVKVFLETFKDTKNAPALILKSSTSTMSVMDREVLFNKVETIKRTVACEKTLPNIYLLHGDLSSEEMNALYNHKKVKAHVSFTKGEGFGRPLLEATLSRKPVIASGWSGHIDFLQKQNSVLLPGQLTKIHPSAVWEDVLIAESAWFTVNYTAASAILKDVWHDYNKYKNGALKQALFSESQFSLNKMNKDFETILTARLPKFAEHVEVTLPDFGSLTLPKLKPLMPIAVPKNEPKEEVVPTEEPKAEETNENKLGAETT